MRLHYSVLQQEPLSSGMNVADVFALKRLSILVGFPMKNFQIIFDHEKILNLQANISTKLVCKWWKFFVSNICFAFKHVSSAFKH